MNVHRISEPFLPPLADLQNQYRLLRQEYEWERELYKEQTERTGIDKKIRQGLCWYPVGTGKTWYNSLNQLVVEIEKKNDTEAEHAFEPGRPVSFFTQQDNGKLNYLSFTGIVSYVQDNRIMVIVPSSEALIDLQKLVNPGIQLYFDETSYKMMFQALQDVMKARDTRLAELREILLGKQSPGMRELFPIRFPWLNPSQEKAVNQVIAARDVYIVHGPPGTGKTTTLTEAVYETLQRENQVLVCAQSNIAVDWISEQLTDRGVHVLRIGNPTRVNEKMLSFTYERRFEAHPDYPELWSIRKTIREIRNHMHKKSASEKDTIRNRLSRLKFRETELEIRIDAALFGEARVIASTLVGSGNKLLHPHHFTTLFIDEAAQALEAACWIAIAKADRVVLAGDHQQLPPTIKDPEAAREGLATTLMQKIVTRKPAMVSLLEIQYRMHEQIMRFPSKMFYDNRLIAAPEVRYREIFPFDSPLVWLDTSGCHYEEEQPDENMSRTNRQEAVLLVLQLQVYMEQIGKERLISESIDFGLISPYKAQVYYLRKLIRQNRFFQPYRKQITVHTVDGFQGQERDVVLISMVRSNDKGRIGFLNDLRRMNVAITRARMKLFIAGDSSTLSHHPFYREFFDYVMKQGKVIPIA